MFYIGPSIIGMDPFQFDKVKEKMDSLIQRNIFAKAAIDMALYMILQENTCVFPFTN